MNTAKPTFVCPPAQCTYCGACTAVCTRGAIALTDRLRGSEARMDNVKCVSCGACTRVCPVLHTPPTPGAGRDAFFAALEAGKNPDKTVFSLYPKARAKTLLKNALHTLGAYKGGALQYGLYYKEK